MDRIASQDLDHQVYVLAEVDAVISKAKAMIAQASELILVDSFPQPLAALTASLVDAVKTGSQDCRSALLERGA